MKRSPRRSKREVDKRGGKGLTRVKLLRTEVKLTLRFKRRTREVVVSDGVLEMLSESTRKIVMDESIDDNQRFRVLIEELYWTKGLSTNKLAMKLNVKRGTVWKTVRRLGVDTRDKATALRLANTGRYKYIENNFCGDDVEKLKMWFLAHTDVSVTRAKQQVKVVLFAPDPYLALLFKELFGRYGRVGVAPYKNNHECHMWELWTFSPLSLKWLLEKEVPAHINERNLYDVLSVVIDAEGSISAYKHTRGGVTVFDVVLYGEKEYVVKPLYQVLARLGYNPRLGKIPKGRRTKFGALNSDYHYFVIRGKANIKRLFQYVKLALPRKRLKACLIIHALSDPARTVYWKEIKPLYAEVNCLHEEVLA